MVRFSKLTLDERGNAVESEVRDIKHEHIMACPHYIIVAEHYRDSGACKCNDPNHTVMSEWGYVWSNETMQWESPRDE